MQWNQKYDYPKSSRATVDGIRRYLLGETKLPSVTSILDATRSEEDKAALANWRERTGQKEAEAIKKTQKIFLQCYFDNAGAQKSLEELIENKDYNFSRYNFFLINYLLSKNKINEAKKIIKLSRD